MGFFDSKIKEVSTLSPEQEQLMRTLGPRLTALSAGGPEAYRYSGQLTAPITAPEQSNVDQLARLGTLSEGTLANLMNVDQTTLNQRFDSEIANPAFENYRTNIQPYLEQELPTFSTARTNVVARGYNDLNNQLSQQRFAATEAAKDRALNAVTTASNTYAQNQKTLAAPREIVQAGLDKDYENFINSNTQYQEGLNSALAYLGIQTKAVINEGSMFDKVIAAANTAANMVSAVTGGGTSPIDTKGEVVSGGGGGSGSAIGNNSSSGARAGILKGLYA